MPIWLRHPIRLIRGLFLNRDMNDPLWDGGQVPDHLQQFTPGEILPWKGVSFRVGKVIGGKFPMVILIPAGATHGKRIRNLRIFRDMLREVRDASVSKAG